MKSWTNAITRSNELLTTWFHEFPIPYFEVFFMNQIILKKRETKMKRVKFFWFARKLSKIQFTVLRICENMGGLILYQKSFCHLQVKQTAHSIVSKIFNSFPQIRWFWQRKTTTNRTIFFWFAKIHYIFGIENSWNNGWVISCSVSVASLCPTCKL